jgi:ribonuclease-3
VFPLTAGAKVDSLDKECLNSPLDALATRLGYTFKNSDLLAQALTHRSFGAPNNERLEFLGDAVLDCIISRLLFDKFPEIDEGDLSRLRANLVKQQALYELAHGLELGACLSLGEGELKSGGLRRPSILADALEALIGAISLDGGFSAAARIVSKLYEATLDSVNPQTLGKDAKTLLQEHMQGQHIPLPIYSVIATRGAAHNQEFEVECAIPKLEIQVFGRGGSRRAAEQAAAKLAITALEAALAVPTARKTSQRKTRKKAS